MQCYGGEAGCFTGHGCGWHRMRGARLTRLLGRPGVVLGLLREYIATTAVIQRNSASMKSKLMILQPGTECTAKEHAGTVHAARAWTHAEVMAGQRPAACDRARRMPHLRCCAGGSRRPAQ